MVYNDKQEEFDGDFNLSELKLLKFIIEMPLLVTGKHINIEINESSFYLRCTKFYELILKFPLKIDC